MNKVDLLFIVDVTGSMGSFINEAQQCMRLMLTNLSKSKNIDLQVGLSLYRDHPSQNSSFVTVTFSLDSVENLQDKINSIEVDEGGGDWSASLDGIINGVINMKWRENSNRIAFLIGDAQTQGMFGNRKHCLCGKTWG